MRSIFALIITLPLVLLGAQWQALNGPPAGRADDMCMGWDPYIPAWVIYAADQTHKLYKSTDEGEYWDSIATHSEVVKPLCVVCEQNNAQVVYIGRNYSTPVYKSENGGINWVEKSNGITNTLPRCFGLDPQSSNRIYLGCGASAGNYSLFFSSNGGTNWYGRGNINVSVNDILVVHEPAQAESVFLATSAGIYLSTDAGMNWYLRQTGNFCSIDNYIDDTGVRIFYATQNMYTGGVYRSEDGAGANWSPLENSPHNPVDIAIQRGSPHYIYCATEYYCVYRSTDNGSSWTQINYHFCDPIVRCLLIHPGNENIIYAGTAECLYKSSDVGNTWIEKTNGFKLTDKACDLSLALPVAIFVSYEGHETWKLESNKWTLRFTYPPWTFVSSHPFGAANGDVLVNDVVPSLVYVTSEVCGIDGDYICRSTDGGWTWQRRDTTHMLLNRKSLAMNPIYDNIIYIVGESPPQFLRSTDYGLTWELHTIYHNSELPNFFSIDLSNSEPQAIYLGDVTYGIAKSMNDGNDWDFYSSGLPGAKISAVAVDPDIPSI
ncbi:MAG: hypothetical protein ABIL20_09170, partial [candidate division WOR-3 bacterium]